MILQSSYTDSTKELIASFNEDINQKNAEIENLQTAAAQLEYELADADEALREVGAINDFNSCRAFVIAKSDAEFRKASKRECVLSGKARSLPA